jgi:hypothetical protein
MERASECDVATRMLNAIVASGPLGEIMMRN